MQCSDLRNLTVKNYMKLPYQAYRFYITLLLPLVLLAGGCFGRKQVTFPAAADSTRTGTLRMQPGTYETDFGDYRAEFGTISVPENRSLPDSRRLRLHVIRILAQGGEERGLPVFYLGGGPGLSNLSFQPFDSLVQYNAFIMVGYRGIDNQSPLPALGISRALAGARDGLGEKSRAKLADALSEFAQATQEIGIDLRGYSLPEMLADIEAVRRALDYDKINLLSESFGTRLAYFYGKFHPEAVGRSVMLGANPPGRFVFQPQTIQALLERYGRLWRADSTNPERRIDLLEAMRRALAAPPKRWLIFPIDAGKVRMAAFFMLYHRRSAPMVFDTFLAAANGDASGLAALTLAYDVLVPTSLNFAVSVAVAASADYDATRDYAAEMAPGRTVLGSPHSQLLWGGYQISDWPKYKIPAPYTTVDSSSVETLILSGNLDFATPAVYATRELLPYLRNGQQITLSDMGHTVDLWTENHPATIRMINSFFATGRADTSLNRHKPMHFGVGLGFPTAAKLLVGAVLFALITLIVLSVFVFKWAMGSTGRRN